MLIHLFKSSKIVLTALMGLLIFFPIVAAQTGLDPDPGIPDTVAITLNVDTVSMQATVQLFIFNDDTLVGVSPGFWWGNTNFVMDSIIVESFVQSGFDIGPYSYENDSLSVTNKDRHFLMAGVANNGNKILPDNSRRLWATYYFTINSWGGISNDGIIVDTMTFNWGSAYLFVAEGQVVFQPVWEGAQVFGSPQDVDPVITPTLPGSFALHQNYPNPFNPVTEIAFDIPTNSQVTVNVYNILGQKVAVLVDRELSAGSYVTRWDGTSDTGNRVASGVYFYKIEAGSFTQTKKMVLVK